MKFRVAREVLAEAVAWTARSLPPRPSVPVLAGIMLEVQGSQLSVSGFDYEVSARSEIDVQSTEDGRTLVPGRLLAEITRALPPHPVDVVAEGARMSITCGNARFSLPTLPVEDYPSLPSMPSAAGVVDSDAFAEAVSQVAVAAGRDDTLPMLTGVRLEIEGDVVTLAATDRYRLAVREFAWRPETPGLSAAVLVPARTLADAAKTLTSGPEVVLSLSSGGSGEGILGMSGKDRQTTTRLLDAEFVKYRAIMPNESSSFAELPVGLFTDAAKRVALVAERGTPLRCEFTPGQVTLKAGGTDDEGQAEERCDVVFDGDPLTIGFNPTFLLDGLAAVHTPRARMDFTTALKPAVLSGVSEQTGDDDRPAERPGSYRYLIMPVRLPG
ncbi:DNA polymerase III subunit beta [Modestobacter sp. VKM Ac-2986]|uniref:DNA polymerase III subunit beta n=1 Tax=Modestobacter sp. VKM Ac-2986 TaxID=3004140 RepID=UPI0022AA218B|nr:DNA polymerase III subunit beta [Modestobacter sp. VKM Ac-2986]MCZ2827383.1 DNA polymerase III subunit beta [Modestobacter sp. VKM Ac-2986]